jgi:hypothetical protein
MAGAAGVADAAETVGWRRPVVEVAFSDSAPLAVGAAVSGRGVAGDWAGRPGFDGGMVAASAGVAVDGRTFVEVSPLPAAPAAAVGSP